ncbi:efflux RND transporter permease subunit [Risungbinella massiliensis]|uniref:efflux RND transporter permease subunit n=1 Tax=Risungbinella massiliensis TaxID=1329796 RepID=UPI00069A4A0A|nr:efflux RND transporter permease subunit [Risungbinella massiliensis]
MSWLTRFSLRNIAAILILVLLVVGGGIYSSTQLKMEAMPDIDFPVLVAITPYPGASPQDIDQKVTQPVEKALKGLKNVQKTNSISAENTSVVVVQYDFDVDLEKAQQEMKEALEGLNLPEQVLKPTINAYGFNTLPALQYVVTSSKKNVAELERQIQDQMKGELESVDGVGQVQVKGEGTKPIFVRLNPDKLKKKNLTYQQVQQALQTANISYPVGSLNQSQTNLPVRVEQKIRNIEDLRNYELVIYPSQTAGLEDAFTQIGDGFEGMGNAIGSLSKAMGTLGQGLGTVGQGVGLLQAQVQILQLAQVTQAGLLADQIALNDAMAKLQGLEEGDPDFANLTQKVKGLQASIQQKSETIKNLNSQLAALQKKLPKPSANSSSKMPSGSSKSMSSSKPKVKDAEIETVKLIDVADVEESAEDQSIITRTNGEPSVKMEIIKDPDANIVQMAELVQAKVKDLQKRNPDLKIETLLDQSISVKASIETMVKEGLLGALFAAIIILIFLRNLRMTLISIVSIPVSLFITLIVLKQADISLNMMTLGGLAVAIGRVVDDSIVVIENIYRHLMKTPQRDVSIIQLATKEVGAAITSSTLTTVAVFLPLGMVDGVVGEVFMPFAITVTTALISSLLVAVTIVPVLAKLFLLKGKKLKADHTRSRTAGWYRKALTWSLDHKAIVLIVSSVLLVASLFLIPLVGVSFIPSEKEKAATVNIKLPSGSDLVKTNELATRIENELKKYPEIETISSTIGGSRDQIGFDGSVGSTNKASIFLNIKDTTEIDSFLATLRQKLASFQKEGEVNVEEVSGLGVSSSQTQIIVHGPSLEVMKQTADELTTKLQTVKGITNVANNLSAQKDLVTVTVKDDLAAKYGLSAAQVASTVRNLLEADKVFEIEQGVQTQEVRLGLQKENAKSVEELKKLEISTPLGETVQLGDLTEVKIEKGPVTIQKEDSQLYVDISGDITEKDTSAVSTEVKKVIDSIKLPEGVSVTIGGTSQEINKSFSQLGVAMVVAVAAVYLVMIISFGEATAPFTILFSLPFAVIGGLVGLWISGQTISVSSMIGALMLIGIVVTNAIVLIDRVLQQRERGFSVREALLEAAGTRLRPILMTALATICALLPLGLGFGGEGTLISQGLAVVVIGGLASSTLLTLFIVPIIYMILARMQDRMAGKKGRSLNI